MLNGLGLSVTIVSNQSGIAKGHLRFDRPQAFERAMHAHLLVSGPNLEAAERKWESVQPETNAQGTAN